MDQQNDEEVPQGPEEPQNEIENPPAANEAPDFGVFQPVIVSIVPGGCGDRDSPIVAFSADGTFEPLSQPDHTEKQKHRPDVVGLPANPTPGPSTWHGAGRGQAPAAQANNPGYPIPLWSPEGQQLINNPAQPMPMVPLFGGPPPNPTPGASTGSGEGQANHPVHPMPIFIGPDQDEADEQEDPAPEA